MAIVKMNRFTLLTFEAHKQVLLKSLQSFEQVHFKKLSPEDFDGYDSLKRNAESTGVFEGELARVNYAAERLKPFANLPTGMAALRTPPKEMTFAELDGFAPGYDCGADCDAVQACDDRIKAVQAEQTKLKAETDNLRPWLTMDAAPSQVDALKSVRYAFGTVNKNAAEGFIAQTQTAFPAVYIETLHTVKDDTVLFITSAAGEWDDVSAHIKNLGFTRVALSFTGKPADKVQGNEARMAELSKEAEAATQDLKALGGRYENLRITADYYRAALERARACDNFVNLSETLIIEGWLPESESASFKKLLAEATNGDYYLEETAVEKESEDVPIALKNNKLVTAFEDVTSMFSLPRYNEIDPTPVLMPFYWLFFGIMVGDAGYGLLLIVATFLALKFFHFKPGMQRFLKFFHYLGYSAVLAGCMFASFFGFGIPFLKVFNGVDPATGEAIKKALFDSSMDITLMLIVSIAIGVIQIFFALGVKAYMLFRDKKPLAAFLDAIMWIIALSLGIGWLLSMVLGAPQAVTSVMPPAFFISLFILAATSGRGNKTIVGKIAGGLFDVYGLTGYVGDLVSYTRLVALALSGGYIAYAFNMMGWEVIPAGFFRVVFGTLVVVGGGAINMGLSLLGAYVHSCRLQYVEFFGKFYEGGGVPFNPLSAKNTFVNIKRRTF